MSIEAMKLALEALEKLWNIIDDIDTYGDMAKADEKLYRSLVERRQRTRFEETGISTDGYTLNGGAITALRTAIEQAEQQEPVEWMTFIPLYTAPPVASSDTSPERVDEITKQRHEPVIDSETVSLEVAIEVVLRNKPTFEAIAGLCKMAVEADRLAQQVEQEPVAWMNKHGACMSAVFKEVDATASEYTTPLYTSPPQRQPLTHEQRFDLLTKFEPHKNKWEAPAILIDMVEAAHKIKGEA